MAFNFIVNAQYTPEQLNVDDKTANYDNYQSALKNQDNLKSKQYESFIKNLYRFDTEKTPTINNLFAHPDGSVAARRSVRNFDEKVYNRRKREIIFRPLFAYEEELHHDHHHPVHIVHHDAPVYYPAYDYDI